MPDSSLTTRQRLQAVTIAALASPLIRALGRTWTWQVDGAEHYDAVVRSGRQPILAFWHGRILPSLYYFRHRHIVVITSQNFDGEWIARIITRFGYGTSRGSTSRGGARASTDAPRSRGWEAGRVHRRRTTRAGAHRAGRRRLAVRRDGSSGGAVSHRRG